MTYYATLRKDEILLFAIKWMELEGIVISEISQREKILGDLIHLWNTEKQNKVIGSMG